LDARSGAIEQPSTNSAAASGAPFTPSPTGPSGTSARRRTSRRRYSSALRSLDRFENTGAFFKVYLATIARNLVRDRWRRHRPPLVGLENALAVPSNSATPEERAMLNIDRDELRRAMRLLSDDHRTVLQLRINDGRSTAEVGQIMGRSTDAVRQLQRSALTALRSHFEKGCPT
jgi:RNA polymerase sigma-70 factor (ECF subfamily)